MGRHHEIQGSYQAMCDGLFCLLTFGFEVLIARPNQCPPNFPSDKRHPILITKSDNLEPAQVI